MLGSVFSWRCPTNGGLALDACLMEVVLMLIRRYMRAEQQSLVVGMHAHTLVLQSLFYIYGWSLIGLCKRTGVLEDDEVPDLEPVIARLPRDMRDVVRRAIKAEKDGHCAIHEKPPTQQHLNLLESRYVWAYEAPLWGN